MNGAREGFCRILEWDSEFFGFRIGRMSHDSPGSKEFQNALSWCGDQQVRCLFFLCPSAAIDSALAAARAGFELIDLRITLYAEPGNIPGATVSEVPIRTARPDDASALRELAGTQFRYTRFWADARFPRGRAAELYRVWIEKDLKNDQGCVLVSESSGELSGFGSGSLIGGERARLNLVAVRSDLRKQGAGRALVGGVLRRLGEMGATSVEVVTQGGSPGSVRLYESQGFRTHSIGIWFHKWLEPPNGS